MKTVSKHDLGHLGVPPPLREFTEEGFLDLDGALEEVAAAHPGTDLAEWYVKA